MPANVHWTPEEIEYLKNNYEKTPYKDISVVLGKTFSAVAHKVKRLGLKKPRGPQEGDVFGRLTIVKKTDFKTRSGNPYYECLCKCGKTHIASNGDLTGGKVSSCGCFRKERLLLPSGEVTLNLYYSRYRNSARNRDLEFLLTKEDFNNIVANPCNYCGNTPILRNFYLNGSGERIKAAIISNISQEAIDRSWVAINGIDRIDSNKGYFVENCVPCCSDCNIAKMEKSIEDFILHCRKIVSYQDSILSLSEKK
jgi:hypothetical protein